MKTKDMACHTWALSGNPLAGKGINSAYESLSNEIAMPYLTGQTALPGDLTNLRQQAMDQISGLCETRTADLDHEIYLCGGFSDEAVCPEHLWLEDRTAGWTYDTFIDQPVVKVHRVGTDGQPFQPGCEAHAFPAARIARVRVDGFTASQHDSLAKAQAR